MSDPLLPEITGHLLAAMDGDIAPSSLRALAARLVDQVRADERKRTIGLLADLQALYPDSLQILLAFALLYPQIDEHGWGHVDERVAAIRHERTGE